MAPPGATVTLLPHDLQRTKAEQPMSAPDTVMVLAAPYPDVASAEAD
jgi:hypothetical protein